MKVLRSLLLVAALLFSQHAAMLHGFSHAQHDLALATQPPGKAPALDHDRDVCAAFGALAQALGNAVHSAYPESTEARARGFTCRAAPALTRIVFDSRAPPLFS